MTSEKITLYRVTEDKQNVVEQLPKTVSSQVYDADSGKFLDETLNEFKQAIDETLDEFRQAIDESEKKDDLPSYWESHLTSKINRVRQLQDTDGLDRMSVGFITDMHLEGNNEKHSGKLMNKVDEECNLSLVINGGDGISHYRGAISKANAIGQIREMFNMFSPRVRDKMLYMVGNHDDNSHSNQVWNETLKEGELYSQFYRHLDNKVVRGETPRYYYIDNEFHKTRYIVLDCNDVPYVEVNGRPKYPIGNTHAFRQTQLVWFANVALNIPDDSWSVMVITHAPPYESGVFGFDRPIRNAEIALGILEAFRDKSTYIGTSLSTVGSDFLVTVSADFTSKGGEVICWLAGDTHQDNVVTMPYADIKLVTTLNDHKNRLSGAPTGTKGTITEQAFDIMTIDRANKNVYLTRIGAGSDRQFSYAPIEPVEPGQIIFEDNFTRENATSLGTRWFPQRGQFRIENNAARPQHFSGTSIALYSQNIQQNNIAIESIFQPRPNFNTAVGIAFRYLNDDNFIRVMLEDGKVMLVLAENDVKTTLTEKSLPYSGTERVTVRVEVINTEIRVFVNGTLELTGNSSKFMDTVRCGIRGYTTVDDSPSFYSYSIKAIDQFSYNPPPLVVGETVFEDNFTRENATSLGSNWIAQRGQFRIESNAARPQHNVGTSIALYAQELPQNNFVIESTIQPRVSASVGGGIAFRFLDDINFLRVMLEANKIMLVLVDNDIKTTLAEKSLSYSGTERFLVRVEVVGTVIKVFVNDTLELTGSSSKFMDTVRCGIRSWTNEDDSPSHYNFSIKQLI